MIWLPGPDFAFILAVGARERLVFPAAGGIAIGYVLMSVVVAAGVAPLVATAPIALMVITVVGASYLVYLGVGVLRTTGHTAQAPDAATTANSGRLLRQGIGVSVLNPKSLVLFVAFLPQFIRPAAPWPVAAQLIVLGMVWAAIGAVCYTALGLTAQKTLGSRPRLAYAVTRLSGMAMIVGGVALVAARLVHAVGTTA